MIIFASKRLRLLKIDLFFLNLTFRQEEYKKIQIELASTSDPTDPSISNATPMSSPNPQNSNESTDILNLDGFANLRDEIEKLNEKPVEK